MSNLPTVFNYNEQEVRTVIKEGEPWFIAKDLCDILEHSDTSTAVSRLDDDEKLTQTLFVSGQNREVWIVNEAGLYSLILTSRKPEAKIFKRWVTHEVLPTIRKTGGYVANEDMFIATYLPTADENTKAMFKTTLEALRQQNEKLAIMSPKAEMYDILLSGDNCQTMGQIAKSFGWGRNKLFARLRDKQILMRNNLPYQKYIDSDHFEVREVSTFRGDKTINVTQTMVTAKGIDFIGKAIGTKLNTSTGVF